MRTTVLIYVLFYGVFSIPLQRQSNPQATLRNPERLITSSVDKMVDLDGDGKLSLKEVEYAAFVHHGLSGSVVKNMFNQVDENGNNFLDSKEFNNIRPLVMEKAENAALRYLQNVDTDQSGKLSLQEAQKYMLKEYGIGHRDVERVWLLVVPDAAMDMDATQFTKLRRRIRGMTIRLARQVMKNADVNGDGHISVEEAQAIAFEQEGIGAGDVTQMVASVDDNQDGELNAPEFADFERIVRARAIVNSKKALKVVDADGSGTLTLDEGKRIAFEHYGFDENVLGPFFDQADEDEDGELDAVEFAGFRSVIRARAVKDAVKVMKDVDLDGDGLVSLDEATEKTMAEDDMEPPETATLFNIADQNKSGKLDKVEFADFVRLVRLAAIRFATQHYTEFDSNNDGLVDVNELAFLIMEKYGVPIEFTRRFFERVDVDHSGDLFPAEIVDFRHEIRKFVEEHTTPTASHETTTPLTTRRTTHRTVGIRPQSTRASTTDTTTTSTPATTRKTFRGSKWSTTPALETFSTKSTHRWFTTTPIPQSVTPSTDTVTSKPEVSQTGTDVEYEVVEVLVDENGNEVTIEGSGSDGSVVEPLDSETRKRLIEEQKKLLNLPESTEVEYIEESADPSLASSAGRRSDDEYEEVVEYVEE